MTQFVTNRKNKQLFFKIKNFDVSFNAWSLEFLFF